MQDYKTKERINVEAEGYTIIAGVGDQMSDIDGGHSGCTFKVPNPFYFIRETLPRQSNMRARLVGQPAVATKIVKGRTFASMLASVPLLHQRRRAVTDVSKSDRRSLFTGTIAGRANLPDHCAAFCIVYVSGSPLSVGFSIARLSAALIGTLRLTLFGGIGARNHLA